MSGTVLQATQVTKTYPGRGGQAPVRAVRGVDLAVEQGASLGIVGESGCGKSTLGRLLVGLEAPTSGSVQVGGVPVETRRRDRTLARQVQLVFQDPFSSLNPRLTVAAAVAEVLKVHGLATGKAEIKERVGELLAMVSLAPRFADRLPHEMSGGQAQRVAIARALAAQPEVLVLDEPTSALDVSVRAEIVNLLLDLRARLGLSYVFISHDMAVIRHVSDRVGVMYLGRFVEVGPAATVFSSPAHPYTKELLEAVPVPDPDGHLLDEPLLADPDALTASLDTAAPSPAAAVPGSAGGCPYFARCPQRIPACATTDPALTVLEEGHAAACIVAAASFSSAPSAASSSS